MAYELGKFSFDDVTESIINKLISRHPHVFAAAEIKTAAEQASSWEAIKEIERKKKADNSKNLASALDGVAKALPATLRAAKLQKRAAKVGFDWPDLAGVFAKIEEELQEVLAAVDSNIGIKEEIGDLLFSVINLARKLEVDPESALRDCNAKFERRFRYVEEQFSLAGTKIDEASLGEMDVFWEEAKAKDKDNIEIP
jgi:MazG family protein